VWIEGGEGDPVDEERTGRFHVAVTAIWSTLAKVMVVVSRRGGKGVEKRKEKRRI
jgi:hypothetical protein